MKVRKMKESEVLQRMRILETGGMQGSAYYRHLQERAARYEAAKEKEVKKKKGIYQKGYTQL